MIGLILSLAILGLVLYLIETLVPMAPTIKTVIRVLVLICVIYYLLGVFGIADLPLPKVNR
jgi:uncharacterized protein YoxC